MMNLRLIIVPCVSGNEHRREREWQRTVREHRHDVQSMNASVRTVAAVQPADIKTQQRPGTARYRDTAATSHCQLFHSAAHVLPWPDQVGVGARA
jgi:hypothetical protein